jgi:hypothetical protein
MRKGETKTLDTLKVLGVSSAATPEGRIALVFHLQDQTIGFEMNMQTIAAMREQIAVLESFLLQSGGQS